MVRRTRRATTLVETLIGVTLMTLVAIGASAMVITVAKQTRVNFSTEYARRQASRALDFMAAHLRRASVDMPVSFGAAQPISAGVHDSVRFLEHRGGAWRWAEFRLGDEGQLIYDPDIDCADDEQNVLRGSAVLPRFISLQFVQSTGVSAVPDNTTLAISLTVSDEGATRTWLSTDPIDFTTTSFLTLRGRSE